MYISKKKYIIIYSYLNERGGGALVNTTEICVGKRGCEGEEGISSYNN